MNPIHSLGAEDARLVLLAAAAGAADAFGYLAFGHILIANMTGNTVLLGLAVGQGQWSTVPRYGVVVLAGFLLGAAIGVLIVENRPTRDKWPAEVTIALTAEGAVLVALAIASTLLAWRQSSGLVYAFIACGALAMGIQTAAVRRLLVAGLSTTVITSTIASGVEGFVARMKPTASSPSAANGSTAERRHAVVSRSSHLGVQVTVIAAHGASAVCVAVTASHVVGSALSLPAALVLLVVLWSGRYRQISTIR